MAPALVAAALKAALSSLAASPDGAGAPTITVVLGEALERLGENTLRRPDQIVLLTDARPAALSAATRLGVQVLVGLDDDCAALREAIRAARTSRPYCSPSLLPALLQALRLSPTAQVEPPAGDALSERELEVARLVARGRSNEEVAVSLFVCEATIKFHLGNVYRKLGIARRGQLAARLPAFALNG